MMITLGPGITLHPGSFTAVVAPERMLAAALSGSHDLRKFLILFVSSGPGLAARIGDIFPYREALTVSSAARLPAILHNSRHSILLVGHDPALFEGTGEAAGPVAGALRAAGRTALVILYAPSRDPWFDTLARSADRLVEFIPAGGPAGRRPRAAASSYGNGTALSPAQTRLEVS